MADSLPRSDEPSEVKNTPTFGVVAEGPSDYHVLRHVLAGYFNDSDIVVRQVQPTPQSLGGWTEVFRFLASDEPLKALDYSDFLVIHVDTDVCEEAGFNVSRRGATGQTRTPDEMANAVIAKLVDTLRPERFEAVRHRVLFAIAVDSIECWLLPLYWTDNRRMKTANCLGSLNEKLQVAEGFGIDPEKKQVDYYQRISRKLSKHRALHEAAPHNPSFAHFIERLNERFPAHAITKTVPSGKKKSRKLPV